MDSAYAVPLIVPTDGDSTPLARIAITGAESEAAYSEDWLQKIVEMTT